MTFKVLLAVSEKDAADYKSFYPELEDAKVFLVGEPGRMEGYRVSEAYTTPAARYDANYEKAWRVLYHSFILGNRTPPRIL